MQEMATDSDSESRGASEGVEEFVELFAQALPAMLADYRDDPLLSDDDRLHAIVGHLTQSAEWPSLKASAQKSGYHERPEVKQLHRVIGGYIAIFSELTSTMRHHMTDYFAPLDAEFTVPNAKLDVLFATMTAKPIAESFFGLSTLIGDLDENEVQVRNQLQRDVKRHISFRNDMVHADWFIGWV